MDTSIYDRVIISNYIVKSEYLHNRKISFITEDGLDGAINFADVALRFICKIIRLSNETHFRMGGNLTSDTVLSTNFEINDNYFGLIEKSCFKRNIIEKRIKYFFRNFYQK